MVGGIGARIIFLIWSIHNSFLKTYLLVEWVAGKNTNFLESATQKLKKLMNKNRRQRKKLIKWMVAGVF